MPDSSHDTDGLEQHHSTQPEGAQVFTSRDIDGLEQHHTTFPGRAHPLTFTIEEGPPIQMPPGWDPLPRGWARRGWLLWAAVVWIAAVGVSVMLAGWPSAPSSVPQRLLGQLLPCVLAGLVTAVIRTVWARRLTARYFAEIRARADAAKDADTSRG
jgi:hypothetical protein